MGLGGGGPVLVGGPEHIADQLETWATDSDLDGFNLAYAVMPETFTDIVDHVIPELQRRGLFKTEYRPGTYREQAVRERPAPRRAPPRRASPPPPTDAMKIADR